MIWSKKDELNTIEQVVSRNSGMTEEELAKTDWEANILHLEDVADYLRHTSETNKKIAVFADYDCDGVCSAVIMHVILKSLNIDFKVYFPKRGTGYGLQKAYIDMIDEKYDTVITIDNGISAFEGVEAAKKRGMDVIIIDHHLQSTEGLPNADIIIDPHVFKENTDDFEDWCGAGLGYELSKILCDKKRQNVCLQFAAFATVADVVPLRFNNRTIVKRGLELINNSSINSIKLLINEISGLGKPHVDETTIGFKIGPIINAMGRVEDDAEYVYRYFISGEPEMLQHMVDNNELRKELVAQAVDRAQNIVVEECLFSDVPKIIYDPQTIEGIVGVVAGRLVETYKSPVICLTDSEKAGIIKGSARSTDDINIKEALDKVSDHLLHYGGHAGAAGLSLNVDELDNVRDCFFSIFEGYKTQETNEIFYDLEIDAADISDVLLSLKKYAPFGEGNRPPVFKINNFKCLPRNGKLFQIIGNDGNTLKLFGNECQAIGFDAVEKFNSLNMPKAVDMIGVISENNFGKPEPQIEISDFKKITEIKNQSELTKLCINDILSGL
jgi:single-stranded-DNA-specific exonuclease